jgi:hypothetical protein
VKRRIVPQRGDDRLAHEREVLGDDDPDVHPLLIGP